MLLHTKEIFFRIYYCQCTGFIVFLLSTVGSWSFKHIFLFYFHCIVPRVTKPIVHRLLDHFFPFKLHFTASISMNFYFIRLIFVEQKFQTRKNPLRIASTWEWKQKKNTTTCNYFLCELTIVKVLDNITSVLDSGFFIQIEISFANK